jgi:activator of HSP90 ATPase
VHDGTNEIFTIRLLAPSGQRRNEDELRRPSHKCDLELRGGAVKAVARRVERSESLYGAEDSSIFSMVMADFKKSERREVRGEVQRVCGAFARDNTRTFGAQITARTREHSGTDIGA